MASAEADRTESTPEQRMLHGSATPDFLDSAHEWRRLFAESWGTFLLVVVAAGAAVVGAQSGGAITLSMKVVALGMMVMAIIYFMGAVGGAPLKSGGYLGVRHAAQFPLASGTGICRGAVCRRYCCSGFPAGHVWHDRVTRRYNSRSGRERHQGSHHGNPIDDRLGQHDSWHCFGRS